MKVRSEINKINDKNSISAIEWGPYLSERQWGTVREDYSSDGRAWEYFPFEHAHSRAYLSGEDGIAGICDAGQFLCFGIALWNGADPILKERLFGLSNAQGNHGEDVKELYYYLDNNPTHSFMDYLYKYPQTAFPYEDLIETNRIKTKLDPEYEILDTGVFNNNQYFDVRVTYAKKSEKDIFVRLSITNKFINAADITVLPTLWMSYDHEEDGISKGANIKLRSSNSVVTNHPNLENYYLYFENSDDLIFTNNITNTEKVTGILNESIYVKDAFHSAIINGQNINELRNIKKGTKFSPVYKLSLNGGETKNIYCRLSNKEFERPFEKEFEKIFIFRKNETDLFFKKMLSNHVNDERRLIQRQALSGLLWSKQYYKFDIQKWLNTSDGITPVNQEKINGRNNEWLHLKNKDIILMPDKWEYPWYAAWDLAFQCIALAKIDPSFAKDQLLLIMRETYMKPDGQLPAYEWNFSDVNPPVHAWAAFQVYHKEKLQTGNGDIVFLKRIFHKLLINFTWWINRKDKKGRNIFEGGFLGLDNIGIFNRSLPGHDMQLEQADATSWMGTYSLNMMDIALEISKYDVAYEDSVAKFYDHFEMIAKSINGYQLWNHDDKFYYDVLSILGNDPKPLQVKSIVGLISLFAISIVDRKVLDKLKNVNDRPHDVNINITDHDNNLENLEIENDEKVMLSLVPKDKIVFLLQRMLNENEFLSPGGIRSLSRSHLTEPYSITIDKKVYEINYDAGDSTSNMFGGNSNWRGPVWMPINYLLIKSIRHFGEFYGNEVLVEYPVGSGKKINLSEVADELSKRVISLFEKDKWGNRKIYGKYNWFYKLEGNEDLILFYEYFHGDTGHGLGANHQSGWTALISDLIEEQYQGKVDHGVNKEMMRM